MTSKPLQDDTAYVRLGGFAPDAAERVFKAISRLGAGRTLTGACWTCAATAAAAPAR
ncbi:hypothetical protein [Streptosporangium roseum]|uniref:hypothetical protein n=1 Tax=Streptosporangium roseum TaxID=2001 RepID=UPI0033258988